MHTIVLRLDPAKLANPDADMRYILPDFLAEKSGFLIQDDGYDYEDETDAMLLYLKTADVEKALVFINDVFAGTRILDNDLKNVVEIIVDK